MDDQVGLGVAVRIVGQRIAELAQRVELHCGQRKRLRERSCHRGEIVTERRDDGPDALPASKMAVDQYPGAHLGRAIDGRAQLGPVWNVPGVVMVEPVDGDAAIEQHDERSLG